MADTSQVGASNLAQLDHGLLDAKLSIPARRDGMVSRAPIIATARASGRKIVAVSAPAGYGKTSLLAQWAAMEDRAVAWVSFDRFDDDPVAVLGLLASAIVQATGADPSVVADMRVHSMAALGRAPHLVSHRSCARRDGRSCSCSTISMFCARRRVTTC